MSIPPTSNQSSKTRRSTAKPLEVIGQFWRIELFEGKESLKQMGGLSRQRKSHAVRYPKLDDAVAGPRRMETKTSGGQGVTSD